MQISVGDKWFSCDHYFRMVEAMRQALGSLNEKTAEMIAYNNAQRVFGEK